MSTQQDNEILAEKLSETVSRHKIPRLESMLLVGVREPHQIAYLKDVLRKTRTLWTQLADNTQTCDFDEGLNPTIIHDLSSQYPIPAMYDIIVCSNTLMYVGAARRALDNLIHMARHYLFLIEPITRERPDVPEEKKDGSGKYHDINRFYPEERIEEILRKDPNFLGRDGKISIPVPKAWQCHAYANPTQDKISALWIYRN